MFNKINYDVHEHQYLNYPSTVKELKAPTDDSIRLLNEFQLKAKENIIKSIHIKDTIVDAIGIIYAEMYNPADFKKIYSFEIKFKINGQEFYINETIPIDRINYFNLEDTMLKNICSGVSNVITKEVLKELLKAKVY